MLAAALATVCSMTPRRSGSSAGQQRLAVHGFRVDVPDPGTDEAGIAALFVASLGLLMTESVSLSNVEVFAEPHKGTRGGPSGRAACRADRGGALVELSHVMAWASFPRPGPGSPPRRCASRDSAPSRSVRSHGFRSSAPGRAGRSV